MCLVLESDSARQKRNLRRRKKPITVYKVLTTELRSPWHNFQYRIGEITRGTRETTRLLAEEISAREICNALHFYLDQLGRCPSPHPCPYPYPCPRQYPFPYRCFTGDCPLRLFKCEIQPEDIVAVGHGEVATTKCRVIGEVK